MALRSRWSFRTLVAVLVTFASIGSALAVEKPRTETRSTAQPQLVNPPAPDPAKPIPW